jgi:peptide/nickel transport system permease protein
MMRMTRAAIINLLASPYIEMARLKGCKPQVVLRHALPNAWAPIANVIAFNLAYLVVGVVVVEVVFVYPGIGQLMVDSVSTRDIPVVQACALIFAATYILLNLLADIVSIITNPKILHPDERGRPMNSSLRFKGRRRRSSKTRLRKSACAQLRQRAHSRPGSA